MNKQSLNKSIFISLLIISLLASLLSCGKNTVGEGIDFSQNQSPCLVPEEGGFFFTRYHQDNDGLYFYDLESNHSVKILHSIWEDGINVYRENGTTHKGNVAHFDPLDGIYSHGDRLYFFVLESQEHGFPTTALYSTKKDGSELITHLTDLPKLMQPMHHRGHLYACESSKGMEWETLYDIDLGKGTISTYDREFSGEVITPYKEGFLMLANSSSRGKRELRYIEQGKEDLSYPVQAGYFHYYGDERIIFTTGEGDYRDLKNELYNLETKEQKQLFDDIAENFILDDEIIRARLFFPDLSLKEKRTVEICSMEGEVLRSYELPFVEEMIHLGLYEEYFVLQDKEDGGRLILLNLKTGEQIQEKFDEE